MNKGESRYVRARLQNALVENERLQTELRYTIDQLRPLADFCVNVVELGDEPTPMTNAIYQLVTAYDETGSISRVMNGVR